MTTGCDSHFLKASQLKDVVLFGFTPRTAHPLPDAATLAGGVAHLYRSWSSVVPLPGHWPVPFRAVSTWLLRWATNCSKA